jgi:hypothetical protein
MIGVACMGRVPFWIDRNEARATWKKGHSMSPLTSDDWTGSEGEEELAGRRGTVSPERFNRRKVASRLRKRARRAAANEGAKRGMHQRRNKRVNW